MIQSWMIQSWESYSMGSTMFLRSSIVFLSWEDHGV